MQVVSVNVGLPRDVEWKGKTVSTGIFKAAVPGPVALRGHNLDGDEQADRTVHGGAKKAVYAYPVEYYDYWRRELPDAELPWGSFGENLTVGGMADETTFVGDEYRVGRTRLVVTEPRIPCFKLSIRFGSDTMAKRFMESRRHGFYLGVVEEGVVEAGDSIERVVENPDRLSISEVSSLYSADKDNETLLKKAIATSALSMSWRGHFESQLEGLQNS